MVQYKSHRKSFIMAALIILLCLVCLTGATLALFTNDLSDGTIGIITTSGSVKVDIVDDTAEQNSLVGKVLAFYTSSERQEVLFEPGATFYTQGFKVKNLSNIPINFRVYISEDETAPHPDETDLIADGYDKLTAENFHKAFDVWITTDPNDPNQRTDISEFVGELEAPSTNNGQPGSDESTAEPSSVVSDETYYLVIRMKEHIGNDYQGKYYTGIGVTVYAIQGNAELKE